MPNFRDWTRSTWVISAGLTGLVGGTTAYVIYKSKKKPEPVPEPGPDKKQETDTKTEELDTTLSCVQALEALPKELMYFKGTSPTSPFVRGKSLYEIAKKDLESKDPVSMTGTADAIKNAIANGYYDSEGNLVKIDPKHAVAEKCLRDMAGTLTKDSKWKFELPTIKFPSMSGEYVRTGGRIRPRTAT